MNSIKFSFDVPGDDFNRAGDASTEVKRVLKKIGFDSAASRRVAIAMYEAEINMVIHGGGGKAEVEIFPDHIDIGMADSGPGIPNIEEAMREGFSTASADVRSLGFGAGMGLPNIKKYSDKLEIDTAPGMGTKLYIRVDVK